MGTPIFRNTHLLSGTFAVTFRGRDYQRGGLAPETKALLILEAQGMLEGVPFGWILFVERMYTHCT